jgi:hypothetical protein
MAALNILSDLFLSLMPLTFIWRMHRQTTEKILLGCLMAAGLVATAASIIKLATVFELGQAVGQAGSAAKDVKMDLVYGLEVILGAIAASLPCLNGPTHRLLRYWGVIHEEGTASGESSLYRHNDRDHAVRQLREIHLRNLGGPGVVSVSSTQETHLTSGGGSAMSEPRGSTTLKRPSTAKTRDIV